MLKKALPILMMLSVAMTVAAQSGTDQRRAEFEAAGYEVVRSGTQGGMPVWEVNTPEGDRLSVNLIGSFTEARARALDSLVDIIFTIEGLEVDSVRVVFDDVRATAIVIPERFVINGRSYTRFMPSGMQFIFDDAPAYDFRMLVDNLALRINGAYLSQEQFLNRIVRAVDNPAGYIQSSDPQYLAQQIQEIQRLVDVVEVGVAELQDARVALEAADVELQKADEQLQADVTNQIESNVREGERLLSYHVSRGEAAAAYLDGRIDDVHQRIDEFEVRVDDAFTQAATDNLTVLEQLVKMRQGAIVLASRNLFGSLKEVQPETIARVVELREANADLTAEEALSQVNGELSEEQPPLHKKHVQAIYALFFNDYQ